MMVLFRLRVLNTCLDERPQPLCLTEWCDVVLLAPLTLAHSLRPSWRDDLNLASRFHLDLFAFGSIVDSSSPLADGRDRLDPVQVRTMT